MNLKPSSFHLVFIAIIPFALYWGGVDFNYILDDKIVLSENSFVKKGFSGISKIFSTDSFQGYFGEQKNLVEGGRYRPLSLATFAIEYEFFGLNPRISHIVNIFLYALTGILLFFLSKILLKQFSVLKNGNENWFSFSFVVAVLFLTHPIHTEVVANIKGRDEILALFFGIGAILSAIQFTSYIDRNKRVLWAVISALSLFLACMSKENALTFLGIIPLLMISKGKFKLKDMGWSFLFSFIAVALYLYIRHQVLGFTMNDAEIKNPMNNSFYGMNFVEYWSTIFYTLWRYIELLIFPHPLSHDYYPYAVPNADFTYLRPWLGIISYAAMAIYAIYKLIKKPNIIAFGIIFYLFTLSIVSNVFFSIGTFMNERFIYIPSYGFVVIAGYGIYYLYRKFNKILAIVLFLLLTVGYSYKTITRVPVWENNITLNRSAIKASPNSARANLFMGTALYKQAQLQKNKEEKKKILFEASSYLDEAINIWPRLGNSKTKHYSYSEALKMKAGTAGNLHSIGALTDQQLLEIFQFVISKKPDVTYVKDYTAYMNKVSPSQDLVNWYYDVGYKYVVKYGDQINPKYYRNAVEFLNLSLQLQPDNPKTLYAMSDVLKKMGQHEKSNQFLQKAQAINPSIGR